ncbi:HAD family hydrolase [Sneathiella aquimaris]|uniref:HAD family hydrolase n=1 Tax=Sneathiella aquimaris TaxID=2599305 RepID=UPI00146D47E2|nr:HAD family hydrolase [Sneathiella aquimaris]
MLSTLAFDADDTLWENEEIFHLTEARFHDLIAQHVDAADLSKTLIATERRNLGYYGYGIKGFTLSMIETAIEVTGGQIPAQDIQEIIQAGREMKDHPTAPLAHVETVLKQLSDDFRLIVITKGDLFDQEQKLAQSGLGDYFDGVEIVSEKSKETYQTIFDQYGDGPKRSMMIGNSLKSDILPALNAGAYGVHIPHSKTWALEHAETPEDSHHFWQLDSISALPALVQKLMKA